MAKNKETLDPIKRFDPDVDGVADGDPAFEAQLDPATIPPDLHVVWVNQSADPKLDSVLKYKHAGYREVRAGENGDGIRLMSGLQFADGDVPRFFDHVLMVADKATHQKRHARERATNAQLRSRMLSKKRIQGDIFIGEGNGPRPMISRR